MVRLFLHLPLKDFFSGLKKAFAIPSEGDFSVEDRALLKKISELVVERGMALPALLFLESIGPLNFVGSQVMHFLNPFADMLGSTEWGRLASILERREGITLLKEMIEEEEARHGKGAYGRS